MDAVHVIGFDGSPVKGGTCATILKRALSGAERAGASIELVRLQEVITAPFHGVHDPKLENAYKALPASVKRLIPQGVRRLATDHLFPEEVRPVIAKIEKADAFIFASPTWWSMPSDFLKTLLNYLTICDYRGYSLRGKVAGFIGVCEEDGAQHVNALLQNALTHMGVATPPFCSFFFNKKMVGQSEENWQETDQELLGANVARMARLMKSADFDWNEL
jgi:multimeric flavodoxin WrbA